MKLSVDDLPHHLSKGLQPLYVIHGAAMLLAIEAADAIRAASRNEGCDEREVLIADTGFKWAELRNSAQGMSLFSAKKLLDLRIPTGKPGAEGAQALQDYCRQLNTDTVTLITLPRLDGATMKSKWFSALAEQAVVINADEVPLNELPLWIAAQ
jgi:DNA polymerase III subunit delta